MKKALILLSISIVLSSCTKVWKCDIETKINGQTIDSHVNFTGSKDEMKEYEALGTSTNSSYSQTTKCH